MADYIPITDQEIEPEAPITSILQHKLRDNPIAIAEGADGAPRISAEAFDIGFGTIQTSIVAGERILTPGGVYALGNITGTTNTGTGEKWVLPVKQVPGTPISTASATWLQGGSVGTEMIYTSYYLQTGQSNGGLMFAKISNLDDSIESLYHSKTHPSYGNYKFFDHPFLDIDYNKSSIKMIYIDNTTYDKLLLSTYAKIGGGFVGIDGSFSEIDILSNKRSFFDAFFDNFVIDYSFNTAPSVDFAILTPINNKFIHMQLPDSENYSIAGYSLI